MVTALSIRVVDQNKIMPEKTKRSLLKLAEHTIFAMKSGVLYWYSKKEGHGCCNGPNVKVECAIHI